MSAPTIEPLTPEWHAARRRGIGASEIAAVLGISPWESPVSLYWRKVHGWVSDDTEETRTGRILEPAIADWGAQTIDPNENLYFRQGPLEEHPDRPWELATPDRVVYMLDEDQPSMFVADKPLAVLECKWTGSWDAWGDQYTDDIPVYYRAQVQWQCDVVGVEQWYLAALGPSGFRLYSGRRDDRDIAVMVEHGRRFMQRIEAGDPPPLDDHVATIDTLKRLHPELVDQAVTVPSDVALPYLRAVRMARLADRLKKRYEAQLRDAMEDARVALTVDGRKVATRVVTDVAEATMTRAAHRRDYLLPPREKKP